MLKVEDVIVRYKKIGLRIQRNIRFFLFGAVEIQLMHLFLLETKLSNQRTYLMTRQCVDWNNTHADTNPILFLSRFLSRLLHPASFAIFFIEWLNGNTRSNTSSFKVLDSDKFNQIIGGKKCMWSRNFFVSVHVAMRHKDAWLGKCAHRLSGKSINTRNAMLGAGMGKCIYIIHKIPMKCSWSSMLNDLYSN